MVIDPSEVAQAQDPRACMVSVHVLPLNPERSFIDSLASF